jgi:hypothetical protein
MQHKKKEEKNEKGVQKNTEVIKGHIRSQIRGQAFFPKKKDAEGDKDENQFV